MGRSGEREGGVFPQQLRAFELIISMEDYYLTEDVRALMDRLEANLEVGRGHMRQGSGEALPAPRPRHQAKLSQGNLERREQKTITAEEFQKTTLKRMQARRFKAAQALEDRKTEAELQLQADTQQFHLSTNPHKASNHLPISQRYQQVLREREEKIRILSDSLRVSKEKAVSKDLTFKPDISQSRPREKRTAKEFFAYNEQWKRERMDERERERQKAMVRSSSEVTLKPDINPKSRKLADKKPLEMRFSEYEKKRKERLETLKKEQEPSFHPSISLKSQILTRKAATPPAFTRLYSPRRPDPEEEEVQVDVVEPDWGVPLVAFRLNTQ